MRVKRAQFSRSNLLRSSQEKQTLGEESLQMLNVAKKSDSIHLPKIESSLQSYQSTSRSGMDALESYVHKLLTEEQQQIFHMKRYKKRKKQQQIVQQEMALGEQKEKKNRQKLYLNQLVRKLNELKDLQKLQQKKLIIQNTMNKRMNDEYNHLFPKSSKQNSKNIQVQTQTDSNLEGSPQPQAKVPIKSKKFIRKFRIAGFVVFFSLAFPKYVKIFRELRKVYFMEKVIKQKNMQKEIANYVKVLSDFRIDTFFRDLSKQKRKQKDDGSPTFSFGEIDEQGNESSFSIKLSHISQMALFMLKNIATTIKMGQTNQLFKVFSFYFLNGSFLGDQIFLTDELYRLKVNIESKTLTLEKDQEIILLIYAFLSKITCFNFMVAGDTQNENGSNSKLKKSGKRRKGENIEHQKTLLMGGLYLFHKCNQHKINSDKDAVFRTEGNIESLQRNDFPKPKPDLKIGQHFEIQLSMGQRKRTSIEQNIRPSYLNNNGIKYIFMEKMQDLVQAILDNSNIQVEIDSLIGQISNEIHKKCWDYRKEHFNQVHLSAINHKYFLTKPIQSQKCLMKRLPKQINVIQECIKLIVDARALANRKKKGNGKMVTIKKINSKQSLLSQMQSNKKSNLSIKHTQSAWGSKNAVLDGKQSEKQSKNSIERGTQKSFVSKNMKVKQTLSQSINSGTLNSINKENQSNQSTKFGKNKKKIKKNPLQIIQEGIQNKE